LKCCATTTDNEHEEQHISQNRSLDIVKKPQDMVNINFFFSCIDIIMYTFLNLFLSRSISHASYPRSIITSVSFSSPQITPQSCNTPTLSSICRHHLSRFLKRSKHSTQAALQPQPDRHIIEAHIPAAIAKQPRSALAVHASPRAPQ
jgi:hypothetical protein